MTFKVYCMMKFAVTDVTAAVSKYLSVKILAGYCRVRSAVTDVTAAVSKYLSVKILAGYCRVRSAVTAAVSNYLNVN